MLVPPPGRPGPSHLPAGCSQAPSFPLSGAQPSHLQNGGAQGTECACLQDDRGLGRNQRSGLVAVNVVNDERPKEGTRVGEKISRKTLKVFYTVGSLHPGLGLPYLTGR